MNTDLVIIDKENIKDKIYYIRNQKVMIDSDLAKIYGYSTKRFNEQVKNNIEKFDDDFMFRLTDKEALELSRSKKSTSMQTKGIKGGRVYNPYAFTESGIYMLMTVLKGELAIKQSKALIRIFKEMKDYLIDNNLLEQSYINNLVLKHENKFEYIDNEIKNLNTLFDKFEEKEFKNKIFMNGKIYDSYSYIIDILDKAKDEIIIIDNYADKTILDIISNLNTNVILITKKNNLLKNIDIDKYNKQYHNLKVIYNNDFHDRFIILDNNIIYHLGSSINYLGNKIFAINIIEEDEMKKVLLNKIKKVIM